MKKIISTILSAILALSVTFGVMADNEISVTYNGQAIEFDQAPVIQDGRTLVPLRAIFETLGAEVYWNGDIQTVTAYRYDDVISLQIGNNILFKNDTEIEIDVPAQIINDRTLVPVRAISEAFECDVAWDDYTRTVIITASEEYIEPEHTEPTNYADAEAVWVGDTGTKYHYQDCPTLKGNGHEITFEQALAEGREPCKVCRK
ncbi:MAG: copper amine oxidase N-terminal domain-containing protein [Clostridia bacterium]|nr:copper amine oxidase N-terminal domain-containing protein [Clostridia bacterium]